MPEWKQSTGIGRLGRKLRLLISDAERRNGEGQSFWGLDAGYELHFAVAASLYVRGVPIHQRLEPAPGFPKDLSP